MVLYIITNDASRSTELLADNYQKAGVETIQAAIAIGSIAKMFEAVANRKFF